MTFLELCQAVAADSGLVSRQNLPQTVASPVGKWGDVVAFTAQAWADIQRARTDWEFLRADFTHALTIGKATYTPAELGITSRFGVFMVDISSPAVCYRPFRCYDPALGEADTQDLFQISPEVWSMAYGRGEQINQRPTDYALSGGKLCLGPLPDKAYTLVGAYWKAPQVLAADADVPDMPEQFHEAIKWKAIVKISGKDGAFVDRQVASVELTAVYRSLVNDQTRRIDMGAPLA